VFKALGEHFHDYVVYATNDLDMLIVATPEGTVPPLDAWIFTQPSLTSELARVGLARLSDLQARRYGDRQSLEGLFLASPAPANSDFYPFLSYQAPRTRYLGKRVQLSSLLRAEVPVLEVLDGQPRAASEPWTDTPFFIAAGMQRLALWTFAVLTGGPLPEPQPRVPPGLPATLQTLLQVPERCDAVVKTEPSALSAMQLVASLTTTALDAQRAGQLWQRLRAQPCFEQHTQAFRAWFELFAANARRDAEGMQRSAAHALQLSAAGLPREQLEFALTSGMVGALRAQGPAAALDFYAKTHRSYQIDEQTPLALRLVVSNAALRAGRLQ
jgi:hypothetical protein